jgi:succinoglycan biosynthesis transport protein ExoP
MPCVLRTYTFQSAHQLESLAAGLLYRQMKMLKTVSTASAPRQRVIAKEPGLSPEHYLRLIFHRKWLVLGVTLMVSAGTAIFSHYLPNVYSSETLILVDPQKVPDAYVKSTVTGDVRNRLSTLSQQILSATRLQKIIEALNLYPEDRKKLAREDVITRMRSDISVQVVSDFGATQDLQAFRIGYSGKDARLVAQVTNELASLFIEENLKAREQQATGTTEFLGNQLQETRRDLEQQEAKLKDYRMRHIGEMPEQQSADLQILGQLQSQFQLEGDALNRGEQQKLALQSMMSLSAPVVDLDDNLANRPKADVKSDLKGPEAPKQTSAAAILNNDKAKLAILLSHYTADHPDVKKLKKQIEQEEATEATRSAAAATALPPPIVADDTTPQSPAPVIVTKSVAQPINHVNPVIQSQLTTLDAEITRHKEEMQRLSKTVSSYQAKLSAIPLREQEITQLVRDYEISKAHYSQLLGQQLSAETATQLEIRQKGEKFEVLDPGQVAERPARPNRTMINSAGGAGGLILGILLAVGTELFGISIVSPDNVSAAVNVPVLEVIPLILTRDDRRRRTKRLLVASVASAVVTAIALGAVLFYRNQI